MPAWWGTRQSVSPRMEYEFDAMRLAFGDTFKLAVPSLNAPIYLLGTVEINMQRVPQREHVLKILYPHEFPERTPVAYLKQPDVFSETQQHEDMKLRLFKP